MRRKFLDSGNEETLVIEFQKGCPRQPFFLFQLYLEKNNDESFWNIMFLPEKFNLDSQESQLKQVWDKFLVANFFIVLLGAGLFIIGIISTAIGINTPYMIFQKLWFPLFIPSISLFFTVVLIEALIKAINPQKD